MYTLPIERDTEALIDATLKNLGWIDAQHSTKQNVFRRRPKTTDQKRALKGLFPDYILYESNSDHPLIIIEAKKPRESINKALIQGLRYAQRLKAPLVFATDGIFTKTLHTKTQKPLYLNHEEIDEFMRESLAIKYLESNEVITATKKVIKSRQELISIFGEANELLRAEGMAAGVDRFSEFANLLFLKIISEREMLSEEEGKQNIIPKEYRWDFFKDKKGGELRVYINQVVLKFFREKFDDTSIFTDLRIQSSARLKKIIDKLEPLNLIDTNTDIKGDAFEYFLKSYSSGSTNDLGQYFTPRHIVKTLVKLADPKFGELIYDPFCGTGGMLTESFKHIKTRMPQNSSSEKFLRHGTVFGNELTSVARIAKMNMILIGDGHNNIKQADSLEKPVKGEYDVVITNIPFSQETDWGGRYPLPTRNGDSVCIQHCVKALNPKNPDSRAGIIIPEGFLFRPEFKAERQWLVEKFNLHTIVSLPSGVFLPYTPQKTDILFIKLKDKAKPRNKIWFFDVKSDGYSLNNYRRPINNNDLDKLLDGIDFDFLEIDKIKKNNYQLIKNLYQSQGLQKSKYQTVPLSHIATVSSGNSAPQQPSDYEKGTHIFIRVSDLARKHIDFNVNISRDHLNESGIHGLRLFPKGTILFPKSGLAANKNHRGILGVDAYVTSHFACIIPDEKKVDPYYLLRCLISIKAQDIALNEGYPSIRRDTFNSLLIPLPPLNIQRKLIKEITEIVALESRVNELHQAIADKFGADILNTPTIDKSPEKTLNINLSFNETLKEMLKINKRKAIKK